MKRHLVILSVIMVFMAWVAGCTVSSDVNLGEKFSLAIGQSKSIKGEDLQVKFLRVVGDSRCPRNVTCVWAGEVESLVEITYLGSLHQVTLTLPGLTGEPSRQAFEEYLLTFDVEPYPEEGKEISPGEYRLKLTVSK